MRTFALILLVIDAAAVLCLYGFFLFSLRVYNFSAYDVGGWLLILIGVTAILAGGWVLCSKGRPGIASVLLLLPAIPAVVVVETVLLVGLIYEYG